jgi:hypothetical protein
MKNCRCGTMLRTELKLVGFSLWLTSILLACNLFTSSLMMGNQMGNMSRLSCLIVFSKQPNLLV